jgi:enoyl-CoA hydratase/carnithine racemase
MTYRTIRYELDGHVAILTLDRPDQRNAISREMNAELHDGWQRFRDADEELVLVITGAGEAFCAGWDLADATPPRSGCAPMATTACCPKRARSRPA